MLRHPLPLRCDCCWPYRLVAAHDHPAGDADARQRDRACARSGKRQPRRAAADRAGPREAQPDLHPGRQRRRPSGWPSGPAGSPRARCTEALFNIPTTAHILGGAVIGPDPEHGVVDAAQPRLRLREPAGLRRRRDPGQPRRQPEPDDHRPGRARDGAGPAKKDEAVARESCAEDLPRTAVARPGPLHGATAGYRMSSRQLAGEALRRRSPS